MTWYNTSSPNPGSYNVPATANQTGGARFNRIVSASATFFATGSNAGSIAVSTLAGCTVTLVGGGSLTIPASSTNPIIYEVSVAQVTAGSAFLYYR